MVAMTSVRPRGNTPCRLRKSSVGCLRGLRREAVVLTTTTTTTFKARMEHYFRLLRCAISSTSVHDDGETSWARVLRLQRVS